MLTKDNIEEILSEVTYLDWWFEVGHFAEKLTLGAMYIQVQFRDEDLQLQHGRKWFVSQHSTKDEVVQTALKAVLTSIEHEAREAFLYKGFPIFGPHHSLDDLVNIQQSKRAEALK